jgi:hypothetical protein
MQPADVELRSDFNIPLTRISKPKRNLGSAFTQHQQFVSPKRENNQTIISSPEFLNIYRVNGSLLAINYSIVHLLSTSLLGQGVS